MKNGLVDQPVTSKEPLSDSGRFWYTNVHKLTPNKEIKAWRGRSLVDRVGDEKRHYILRFMSVQCHMTLTCDVILYRVVSAG